MSNDIDNSIVVIKKDGSEEPFNPDKIKKACSISASRVLLDLDELQKSSICDLVLEILMDTNRSTSNNKVTIANMHSAVESALDMLYPIVAKSYKDYRNYKTDFVSMTDRVLAKDRAIRHIGDKENSNTDSSLVATKRSLVYGEFNREVYKKQFLTPIEKMAIKVGYIYCHDMNARRDSINCCLFDARSVLSGGFEMGNIWYNEPKSLDVVFNVLSDIILSVAAQQYGGFTIPEIDKTLSTYAEKSYELHKKNISRYTQDSEIIENDAMKAVVREFEQGWQGFEMRLNTVGSSRGDYPFVTVTGGLGTDRFSKLAMKTLFEVHSKGQGKEGSKKPVLFPKIVMLYDKNLTEVGMPNEDVFLSALDCSSKTMYPDWLSLTGEGYVASMYKKYERIISPMGCRAFLSPWYEKGGMYSADDEDKPVFVGRFNIGAISLNLPLILAKSREEGKDFYEVLDYYLEMIRGIHIRTYEYLSDNIKASTNPVAFCEGGFYNPEVNGPARLKPSDTIKPLLRSATASFGITAFNELQELYNNKSIAEVAKEYLDSGCSEKFFALEVLEHINNRVNEYKVKDGNLYAIYGTPAESLCGTQVRQFRDKYGIIPGVSDKEYVSNSFHCHVTEDINPIQKQDYEGIFWDLCNGGKIQYVRYPVNYNKSSMTTLIRRAMELGFYEGVNLALSYCDDCGYEELEMEVCPKCGSKNLTKIDRMNGYLSYSRVNGDTRLNESKMAEIRERKSM